VCVIDIGCGGGQQNVEDEIYDAKTEMQNKLDTLSKKLDSCYTKTIQMENKSDSNYKGQIIYFNVKSTIKYLDSLRWDMNKLNTLDVLNMENVKQEYTYKRGFDSVLAKVNDSYLLISGRLQNSKRKFSVDSIVNEFNRKFKTETFDGWTSIAMSSILFDIEKNILVQANNCSVIK
jgi:hypothetical protein